MPSRDPQPLLVPVHPNQVWSADFMSDTLYSGTRFRTFNVIDDFNREALAIEIDRVDERMRQIEAVGDDPNSMESIELERARTRYEALTSSATELFEQNKLVLETLRSSCERITSVQAHRARVRRELDDVLNEMASLSERVGLAGT